MPTGKPRVLVTAMIVPPDHPKLERLRAAGHDVLVKVRSTFYTQEEMIDLVAGVGAVVAGSDVYSDAVLGAGPLKVISRVGVGYDTVDVRAATARKIAVCTVPGTNQDAVADHAFALLMAVARQLPALDRSVRAGHWRRPTPADVHGQTLGILGLGKIGKGVARRARGFDMRVVAFDPFWDEAFAAQHQVERLSLEEVLRQADYVTLHLPAGPETRHIVDAARLALLKPTAYLVNTARGTLVDEEALYQALRSGKLAGAGLDVFDPEPPRGSKLLELENVILTPHVAGFSPSANAAMVDMSIENVALILEGKRPLHCVNPEIYA